jgi:hypothetical protein
MLRIFFSLSLFFQILNIPAQTPEQKVVTGSVLLNALKTPDGKALAANLKKNWKLDADSLSQSDKTVVFSVPGATVMLAWLDYAPPAPELRAAARISWLWPAAETEALRAKAQVVISVIGSAQRSLDLHKVFSKVAGAVLEQPQANGMYMSDRYLLLSKDFYHTAARNMLQEGGLPLYCWVYFGMQQKDGLNGAYTYGMQEFGYKEMEVAGSKNSLQEIHATLYDVASYVVQSNYTLKDATVFDRLPDLKINVRLSPATYIDGQTFKLEY